MKNKVNSLDSLPLALRVEDLMPILGIGRNTAYELVRRIVLAWDPDFTKLTPDEAAELDKAEADFARGDVVSDSEIDWDAD